MCSIPQSKTIGGIEHIILSDSGSVSLFEKVKVIRSFSKCYHVIKEMKSFDVQ